VTGARRSGWEQAAGGRGRPGYCVHCGLEVECVRARPQPRYVHRTTREAQCSARPTTAVPGAPEPGRRLVEAQCGPSAQDAHEELLHAVWEAEENWRFDDRLDLATR
jgi:hypothetical protein